MLPDRSIIMKFRLFWRCGSWVFPKGSSGRMKSSKRRTPEKRSPWKTFPCCIPSRPIPRRPFCCAAPGKGGTMPEIRPGRAGPAHRPVPAPGPADGAGGLGQRDPGGQFRRESLLGRVRVQPSGFQRTYGAGRRWAKRRLYRPHLRRTGWALRKGYSPGWNMDGTSGF